MTKEMLGVRVWRQLFLYIFCLLSDFLGLLVFLLIYFIYGKHLSFEKKPNIFSENYVMPGNWCLTCDLKKNVLLWWKYDAITLAPHIIIYRHGKRPPIKSMDWSRIQDHEHFHSQQFEVGGLIGFICTIFFAILCKSLIVPIVIFAVFPWIYMGCSYIVSWFRGEDFYRGSCVEKGARGVDDYFDNLYVP